MADLASPSDRSNLRSLAAAATPGPWVHNADLDRTCVMSSRGAYLAECDVAAIPAREMTANAAWIAAASPQVVVGLLDRIEELEKQLIEACEWWESHLDGFAKRLGEEDGGIKSERRRLDTIKRRAM
jgi:hypothetical protein